MNDTIKPGEVHVRWRATASASAAELAEAMAVLSPEEQARHARFRLDLDRREYAFAHALLRNSLSRYSEVAPNEWQFVTEADGKPFLAPGSHDIELSFSLSHTNGLVACAIANGTPVGIDAECVVPRTDYESFAHVFAAAEIAEIQRFDSPHERDLHFYGLWTLKEAFVKATGEGLSDALPELQFSNASSGTVVFKAPRGINPADWSVELFSPTPNHRLAIAAEHPHNGPPLIFVVRDKTP